MFLHLTPLLISSRSLTVIWCSKWLTSSQNMSDFTRISKKTKPEFLRCSISSPPQKKKNKLNLCFLFTGEEMVKKSCFPLHITPPKSCTKPFHGAEPSEEIWWFLPTLLWWVGRPSCFQEIPHLKMCPLELFFNQQKWGCHTVDASEIPNNQLGWC